MQNPLFSSHARRERIKALILLMVTAVFVRLGAVFFSSGSMEVMQASSSLANHANELPPMWGLWAQVLQKMADWAGLPSSAIFKFPALIADAWMPILLLMILSRLTPEGPQKPSDKAPPFWISSAFWLAMAWAANPLVVFLSAGYGSIHSVVLLSVLGAAWYVEFSDQPRSDLYAPLAMSLAISLAWWPLAMLPIFMKSYSAGADRLRFAGVALLLPFILSLPLLISEHTQLLLPQVQMGLGAALKHLQLIAAAQSYSDTAELILITAGPFFAGLLGLLYLAGPWRFPLIPALALAGILLMVFSATAQLWMLSIPLLFSLMVPGTLALRLTLSGLGAALIAAGLNDPGALFIQELFDVPATPFWFRAGWGLLNLALWYHWIKEGLKLLHGCQRPARLRFR